ncbi:MAG TPA: transcription antitermination factor NusB [Aestuariivirgaceae bacterium]|nr:transcription antitermination factor NusB [Aestuariivirgaceae bacterium]
MAPDAKRKRSDREVSRSSARLGAVQALYQMDIAGTDFAEVLAQFGAGRMGEIFEDGECGEADFAFLKDIVEGVVREQHGIDRAVEDHLAAAWTLARLDSTLRAVLRAGAYELMFRSDVPARVSITEYVDVAHAFFEAEEPRVVNGVLDALARAHRSAEF